MSTAYTSILVKIAEGLNFANTGRGNDYVKHVVAKAFANTMSPNVIVGSAKVLLYVCTERKRQDEWTAVAVHFASMAETGTIAHCAVAPEFVSMGHARADVRNAAAHQYANMGSAKLNVNVAMAVIFAIIVG